MMLASQALARYRPLAGVYDETFDAAGEPRASFRDLVAAIDARMTSDFPRQQALAELALLQQGVTFSVYSDARGAEKIFPFDLLPRLVAAADWADLEAGLVQRVAALEAFLDDVYGEQRILAERRIPRELVLGSKGYEPKLRGIRPPRGVRIHVAGIDLVRDPVGTFRVLEDNLRTPSGVSYVLENRNLSKRILHEPLRGARVRRVDQYPARLRAALRSVAPRDPDDAVAVVLTPGPYNSAYFEHSFLARTMGVELVQGADLFVEGDRVFMRTTRGPRRVDVVYRRIDDAFLDPEFGNPGSVLGVPGLVRAWANGGVALANAPGNGVVDDKAVYAFVPEMIRFYLAQEPLLAQVPTWVCARPEDCDAVIDRLDELVVKAVDEAGGYGMLMGPQASAAELADFRARILAEPRRYIAQRRLELSTCPTWDGARAEVVPRRVDLRPYIVSGAADRWVLPGGLTRVALREGSYVVNSSQGGGSKDTWVLRETEH
jgi:uncharacterized circularly permuted ATP-grasp superfamily protein